MGQKRAPKGLAQRQAWHAGDMSASPEQGEACELAEVTHAQQARPFRAYAREHMEKTYGIGGINKRVHQQNHC